MEVQNTLLAKPAEWVQTLANVAASVAQEKDVAAPVSAGTVNDNALAVARTLLKGEHKAILLGNAAAHHAQADALLSIAQWIGEQTGATVGYLTEAANTVGAQWVQAVPSQGGQNATEMLTGGLKCVVLLNTEPEWDSAAGAQAATALGKAEMVVTCSPFKANMEFSDVLLPIAPFTETSGSFVNAEGRLQSFHAVVKPRGETRPGWKVLRVLANLLGVEGFDFETSQDVLAQATGAAAGSLAFVPDSLLSNGAVATSFTALNALSDASVQNHDPVVASIYQLDGIVRRAVSLQLTADARRASAQGAQA
jgi:NADH-quinone oxidoreductase subunit G